MTTEDDDVDINEFGNDDDDDESTQSPMTTVDDVNVNGSESDSDDDASTQSPMSTEDDDMNMDEFEGNDHDDLLDEFQPQSVPNEDAGVLVMRLSHSTIANLWAVT